MPTATAPVSDKQYVLETVNRFPDSASLEEITEELAILSSLRKADAEYLAGHFLTNEDVKRRTAECLTK